MLKLSISKKILALVLVATAVPFALINVYWINVQRQTILDNAKETQVATTNEGADDVSLFVTDQVQAMIYRSQDMAVDGDEKDDHDFESDMRSFLIQDPNMVQMAKVDKNGKELVAIDQKGKLPLQNVSAQAAFQAVKASSNRYISSAALDSSGHPLVTIAVPIPESTKPQDLGLLLSQDVRPADSPLGFRGALIAQVDLQGLWSSVLSRSIDSGLQGSYAFVVDAQGSVVAYPKQLSSGVASNLSGLPIVSDFIAQLGGVAKGEDQRDSVQMRSEKGVQVLATYQKIGAADWAIIVEDPISVVYKDINQITEIGLAIEALAIVVFLIISFGLSKFITRPILRIADVAGRIGRGEFGARVGGVRGDEIGTLGQSVNTMGQNLQVSMGRVEDQRRQLEAILNNTTDAILSVDDSGQIIVANNAAVQFFEFAGQTLTGEPFGAFLGSMTSTQPLHMDFATMPLGLNAFNEVTYVSPSNKIHFIDIVALKIQGIFGKPQCIVTIRDDTKRRELDNMKVDFVSMAAHELRTPLSAIQGYLELMIDGEHYDGLPEKIRRYLKNTRLSARELGGLMSNLLNVTRLEHGTLHLHMEKVDLAARAGDTIKNSQFSAASRDVHLSYSGPASGCFVVADAATLQEVLNNLVDNAIKYTSKGGQVDLSLSEADGRYVVKVRDTGIGIPESALPHLFTKFYRVHSGLETGSAGTGLGLYLTKTILENHDGTISVASEEGKGSEFTVVLPLYTDDKLREKTGSQTEGGFIKGDNRGWTTKNTPR